MSRGRAILRSAIMAVLLLSWVGGLGESQSTRVFSSIECGDGEGDYEAARIGSGVPINWGIVIAQLLRFSLKPTEVGRPVTGIFQDCNTHTSPAHEGLTCSYRI
ncbi:hypothetical protein F5Y13DRAFT_173281 [Hypoxylon sp. FL1857]|nr:hypothetical protein F5Y13DRAFT_173281 [Hypoxylon sp. FL1857]